MRIVVSGATKGIGRSIVEHFAARGFDIAVCSRNLTELVELKEELESKFSVQVLVKKTDVSIKSEVIEFAEYVLKEWGDIDVLVNNAGVFVSGKIHEEDDGLLEKLIETNLYSAYHLSRAFIPVMKEQESGHIFNISSIAGIQSCPEMGAYGISKFAMMGLNKALRDELRSCGIKVTAILPGATKTSSWDGFDAPEDRMIPASDLGKIVWDCYSLSKQTVVEELIVRPILGDI